MEQGEGGASADATTAADTQLHVQLTCEVAPSAQEMRAVRNRLRDLLMQWQLEERVANAVLDVTHELLVNAHQHGSAPVRLTVLAGSDEIRTDVRDGSSAPARLLPYRPGFSERGLGLQLVRSLSTQWGQTTDDDGKSVWATFARRSVRTG
jgi:two-component sensor histidine kinase